MSDEKYAEKMKEIITTNPELALDLHMEMKEERDWERKANRRSMDTRILIDRNIKTALCMADNHVDVQNIIDMYDHIMADLFRTNPEKFEEYQEYMKSMRTIE